METDKTDKTDCANFYIGDMACRAMDDVRRNAGLKFREQDEEDGCRNDATKMHNERAG